MADVNKQTEEMLSPDDMMLASEPVTNEQLIEAGKDLGQFALESTPVVGEAIIAKDISENISEGDYLSAGLNTAALGVGALPIVGDVLNKPLRSAAKKFSKADTVDETVDTMTAAGLTDADIKAWRRPKEEGGNATSEDFRKSLKGRNPILIDLANARKANEITAKEYREAADVFRPIKTVQDVPEPATTTELVSALGKKSEKGVLGVNRNIPDGDRITARLDINAYTDYDVWIPTITHPDKKTMYSPTVVLRDVSFIQPDDKAVGMALNVATGKAKAPFAVMEGNYQSMSDSDAFKYAKEVFDDAEWTQVGYDPTRRGFFYDRKTGQPVLNAKEVVQVGHLVLAKNAVKGNADDFLFNEGGVVPMKKQMEMFEDGGLKDEGGTVDPVSGNDVPPGSTQEEVRDDIPAQLSEGEFVFPADVVRYIGLGNLMRIRQEAKMGLKMMEEMGQMGNSDEATMPDDLPFDINDLDMEDEIEDNKELEMQVGGFVQPTQQQQQMGISGYQQAAAPTTGVAAVPQQAASQQYVQPVQPVQAAVPTTPVYTPAEIPTFKGFVGENVPGVDFEYVEYKNEAGNVIQLRKSKTTGELLDPVPEGYTFVDPEATKTEEVTTTPTTPQTTTVREEPDEDKVDDGLGPGGGRIGLGGFSVGDGTKKGATIVGVSFDNMGGLPGPTGAIQGTFNLATGKPVPDNAVVTFTLDNEKITIMGDEYNQLKDTGFTGDKATSIQRGLQVASAAKRNTLEYNPKTKTFVDKKSGQTFQDDDDNSILTNAGKSIYSNVDKNNLVESGKRLTSSQKAIASAYNDLAFQDFMDSDSGSQTSQTTPEPTVGEGFAGYADVTGGPGQDDAPADSGFSMGSDFSTSERDELGPGGYNQGGLASKPKPKKTKKKKKGGLASKK